MNNRHPTGLGEIGLNMERGERPWSDVNAWRLRLHKEVAEAFATTKLPERPDYNWPNEFLLKDPRQMTNESSSNSGT